MAIVLIAGGSGLVGSRLSEILVSRGHEVRHFSRSSEGKYRTYVWNIEQQTYDEAALKGVTHVVHLAGAGIADARWTDARKDLIIKSRTESTLLLRKAIAAHGTEVQAYIASSAIGYYGDRGNQLLHETDAPGAGFLSESVLAWETAIQEIPNTLQLPTLIVRTGIVLSTQGGALPKMLLPLNLLTSTYFGDGQQWYSWIHIDDICGLLLKGIEDAAFKGVFNGVSPQPVRNKTLAQALIDATAKPAVLLPAPTFALKIALGEMSHTVLDSCKVSAEKATQHGYHFQYPEIVSALKDVLTNKK
ncbi:MAG: TIGR01777 family oxidoreductase [Saprospiraceae bacterium]